MISFRRWYVDRWLEKYAIHMTGRVLDIGGKKRNPRGDFRPPIGQVEYWKFVNSDPDTDPDILCDAKLIPLPDGGVDCILLCEVLEHVEDPVAVVEEAYRLLEDGGCLLLTMPFLVAVHGDPEDFQRWTESRIVSTLSAVGFKVVSSEPMGGIFPVVSDLVRSWVESDHFSNMRIKRRLVRTLIRLSHRIRIFQRDDPPSSQMVTTGWGVLAQKEKGRRP